LNSFNKDWFQENLLVPASTVEPSQLTTAGGLKPISGTRITDLQDHSNWQSSQLQRQNTESG